MLKLEVVDTEGLGLKVHIVFLKLILWYPLTRSKSNAGRSALSPVAAFIHIGSVGGWRSSPITDIGSEGDSENVRDGSDFRGMDKQGNVGVHMTELERIGSGDDRVESSTQGSDSWSELSPCLSDPRQTQYSPSSR